MGGVERALSVGVWVEDARFGSGELQLSRCFVFEGKCGVEIRERFSSLVFGSEDLMIVPHCGFMATNFLSSTALIPPSTQLTALIRIVPSKQKIPSVELKYAKPELNVPCKAC